MIKGKFCQKKFYFSTVLFLSDTCELAQSIKLSKFQKSLGKISRKSVAYIWGEKSKQAKLKTQPNIIVQNFICQEEKK